MAVRERFFPSLWKVECSRKLKKRMKGERRTNDVEKSELEKVGKKDEKASNKVGGQSNNTWHSIGGELWRSRQCHQMSHGGGWGQPKCHATRSSAELVWSRNQYSTFKVGLGWFKLGESVNIALGVRGPNEVTPLWQGKGFGTTGHKTL